MTVPRGAWTGAHDGDGARRTQQARNHRLFMCDVSHVLPRTPMELSDRYPRAPLVHRNTLELSGQDQTGSLMHSGWIDEIDFDVRQSTVSSAYIVGFDDRGTSRTTGPTGLVYGRGWVGVGDRDRGSGEVVVAVRDTGRGIPADQLPHLFEMFSKGHGEPTHAGLGLAIAKDLVELHGGSIRAASRGPGRGSKFVVRLPETAHRSPDDENVA